MDAKRPIMVASFLLAVLCSSAAETDKLAQVDLAKLISPETRETEVRALLERHNGDSTTKQILKSFRLVACPQFSGKETLHALLVASDYEFGSSASDPDKYQIDGREELFPSETKQPLSLKPLAPPGLERLAEMWLVVFDSKGREIRPFGGDNYMTDGYIADFDRDGIVDRLDTTNYGVADDFTVRVAEINTFESKSRALLNVLYDWHPDGADEANEWGFECFDGENDGLIEIGFGPKDGEPKREVVFRWDKQSSSYVSAELPQQQRIKVLPNSNVWDELLKIKAAGGHKYPLAGKKDDAKPQQEGEVPPEYRFRSLRGASDEEINRFMGGKRTPDSFQPDDAPSNTLPPDFWRTDPKAAALAFVDLNRTPMHRNSHRLSVDDRDGIKPPASGWIVFNRSSASCYTSVSALAILRFGVPEPFLFQSGGSRNGVVASNPLADRTGHIMRLVSLTPAEAERLTHTLFWLDRVRSDLNKTDRFSSGMVSSSADGFGSLDWLCDGKHPQRVEGTLWATFSIASRFNGDYDREVCLNFCDHLLVDELPTYLGARWDNGLRLEHRNLGTPLSERLKPREDEDARDRLAEIALEVLDRHRSDPWPADALVAIANCAGDSGLSRVLPALENLAATLPAAKPSEIEFKSLSGKLRHRSRYDDDDAKGKREWKRYDELQEKLRHHLPSRWRDPLARAIGQLRAIDDPKRLVVMASAGLDSSLWALQQLQLHHPDAYTDVLIKRFRKADQRERKTIFATLAAAHPPGARKLRDTLTEEEQAGLAIELAAFEKSDDPQLAKSRVPALLEIFRNPIGERGWQEVGPAIELLSELPLDQSQLESIESLLLAGLENPRRDDLRMSYLPYMIAAVAKLPDPDRHWDALVAAGDLASGFGEFDTLLEALATLALARPDPRMNDLVVFLKPRFTRTKGMMNDLFLAALALDLRALAPEIARLSSAGPELSDGEGAHSWGGDFEGPGRHRYHAARHVTALWLESDPDTLARMWAALFAKQCHEFRGEDILSSSLRNRLGIALVAASPEIRSQAVSQARDAAKDDPELIEWMDRSFGGS